MLVLVTSFWLANNLKLLFPSCLGGEGCSDEYLRYWLSGVQQRQQRQTTIDRQQRQKTIDRQQRQTTIGRQQRQTTIDRQKRQSTIHRQQIQTTIER